MSNPRLAHFSDCFTDEGRAIGPIEPERFSVIVIEPRSRISHHDFVDLAEARASADDAASEVDGAPVAEVLNSGFTVVHRGRAYNLNLGT